jgi:hypothetical protein
MSEGPIEAPIVRLLWMRAVFEVRLAKAGHHAGLAQMHSSSLKQNVTSVSTAQASK